jgi:hypothetical protein
MYVSLYRSKLSYARSMGVTEDSLTRVVCVCVGPSSIPTHHGIPVFTGVCVHACVCSHSCACMYGFSSQGTMSVSFEILTVSVSGIFHIDI